MGKKYKHLLFDLDGTLTDSKPGIINCLKYAFDRFQFDCSDIDLDQFIGPPLNDTFAQTLGVQRTEEAIKVYRERFSTVGMYENQLYGGVKEMLEGLKEKGFCLSVATSKPELFTETILKHFGIREYFSHVTGSLLDNTRQDKAEVIKVALERAGSRGEDALMIGDRHHDLNAAEKIGIDAMGVLYGYGDRAELSPLRQVYLAESPMDILEFLTI